MRIGLTGDTHNNLKNIQIICDLFNQQKVDLVIHTGDISLPKSLKLFEALDMPLKGVFGNNDIGDKDELLSVCKLMNFEFSDKIHIEMPNKKSIFVVHDPKDIEDDFYNPGNIIFHGHTHRFRDEILKDTYIFNPGECAGHMAGMNSIGVVNTNDPSMEIINF